MESTKTKLNNEDHEVTLTLTLETYAHTKEKAFLV